MTEGHFGAGEREITQGEHGMTRRQLIRHTAWFGAAVALTFTGGEVISQIAGDGTPAAAADTGALRFVQVSDSHLGFVGTANPDVAATFGAAINQVNARSPQRAPSPGGAFRCESPRRSWARRRPVVPGLLAGFFFGGFQEFLRDGSHRYISWLDGAWVGLRAGVDLHVGRKLGLGPDDLASGCEPSLDSDHGPELPSRRGFSRGAFV